MLGDAGSGIVNICVSDEPSPWFAKVLNVSTTAYTPTQLVQDVLITGCLTASNIVYTGSPDAIGYFSNAIPGLDFAEGVIISSGNVSDASGPNVSGSTSGIWVPAECVAKHNYWFYDIRCIYFAI